MSDRTMTKLAARTILVGARLTPYVEGELLGLRSLVAPGGVCVDVGAGVGVYTAVLSYLVGAGGRVHSVEPLPFAHRPWSTVMRAALGPNIRRHGVALGARPGSGTLSIPVGRFGLVTGRSFLTTNACSLGSNAEFAEHVSAEVEIDTLDGLCGRAGTSRLDFVKIDVEG
ncbi:MAG TPA: FkbM family methyltransferase, partial [Acidimicrobiales bacterium]|nr:FkbM family methyltransferase [Acidimicrobiales bacterium]